MKETQSTRIFQTPTAIKLAAFGEHAAATHPGGACNVKCCNCFCVWGGAETGSETGGVELDLKLAKKLI